MHGLFVVYINAAGSRAGISDIQIYHRYFEAPQYLQFLLREQIVIKYYSVSMTLDDVINDLIHLIYTDTCRVQNDVVLIDLRHIQQTVEHLANVGKAAVRDDQGDVGSLLQSQALSNRIRLVS